MNIPDQLKYADSHEWVDLKEDIATIGITDHAQQELSDIVFVELPDVGKTAAAKDPVAVVESVKAASDIYSPLSGTVTEVNNGLSEDPSLVNSAPYEGGWIFKIKISDPGELAKLKDAGAYAKHIKA